MQKRYITFQFFGRLFHRGQTNSNADFSPALLKLLFTPLMLLWLHGAYAQDSLSVLFLGNSYTSFNNLPQLVQSISTSAGKYLYVDSNLGGGMTVSDHVNSPASVSKINLGIWDYVVIQEQSQIPSIDYYRYNDMYPAMYDLKALVQMANPCARLITYMTWGRRYGGMQCDPQNIYCSPPYTDFNHMQDSLTSAYTEISDLMNVQCAPVGETWRNILNDTSLVLHTTDDSHPNLEGSYVAALTLFSSIWKQTSSGLAYNAGIPPGRALYYQSMSDYTVFQSQQDWNLLINIPVSDFSYTLQGNTATFSNLSSSPINSQLNYTWNFDDGSFSTLQNPSHTYASAGVYNVSLIVSDCIFSDTITYPVQIGLSNIADANISSVQVFPNPFSDQILINYPNPDPETDYFLLEASGRIVLQGSVQAGQLRIDTGHLPAGFYLLSVGKQIGKSIRLLKY